MRTAKDRPVDHGGGFQIAALVVAIAIGTGLVQACAPEIFREPAGVDDGSELPARESPPAPSDALELTTYVVVVEQEIAVGRHEVVVAPCAPGDLVMGGACAAEGRAGPGSVKRGGPTLSEVYAPDGAEDASGWACGVTADDGAALTAVATAICLER